MNELRRKVGLLLDGGLPREGLIDLLIDVIARGLGSLGGRPRNGTVTHSESEVSEPVTKPAETRSLSLLSGSGSSASPEPSEKIGERTKPAYSAEFVQFWALYPKKVGKADAWRAWKRIKPPLGKIREALAWQVHLDAWTKDGGDFIPYPATWLRAQQWLDEPFHAPKEPPRMDREAQVQREALRQQMEWAQMSPEERAEAKRKMVS